MPEATSIPRCTEDPICTLRSKPDAKGHGQSSSSISNIASPANQKSYPPSKAITPSVATSALNRKRRSTTAMGTTPSQIDTNISSSDSSNSCIEMKALSPDSSNIVFTGINININRQNEDKSSTSMALPFTSARTQCLTKPQPRRVSMCGSSLKKARSHSPVREAPSSSSLESSKNTNMSMNTSFDPNTCKQILLQRSIVAIKNLSHKPGKKTQAEITIDLPDEAAAMALFQRIRSFSNTDDKIRWNIQGNDEINAWLQKRDEYIHPVESGDWNIWWGAVYNPTYAWAKFDSCEAQYNKQTRVFSLILRTFLYATGKDENGRPSCFVCIE